jgi:hypothetical protein
MTNAERLQQHLSTARSGDSWKTVPLVRCKNGFTMSVQASPSGGSRDARHLHRRSSVPERLRALQGDPQVRMRSRIDLHGSSDARGG